MFVVIGQSPFNDTSIACGPFRSTRMALAISDRLERKGWNTEIVPLEHEYDIPTVEQQGS